MTKKRGSKRHACSVSWVKEENKWELWDLVCENIGSHFEVWHEDECYYLESHRSTPIDDVVIEVLETTYLYPSEITVYDPYYKGDGFCPRRTYDANGVWIDEGKSYSKFTDGGRAAGRPSAGSRRK